eukprot:TRINITY_DN7919_c0_g1_i2.p1 TRINITY_DN7919_c0_g1~~TRINITY_DN7919_c0_g1_i2.p1  ORF type:complete len:397 (+),score=113.48 TRINITY_DN7919_c0_g1_i2:77-1267(+)
MKTVLILGGGYTGAAVASKLKGACSVVVVERKDFQDHCIAALRGYAAAGKDVEPCIFPLQSALPHAVLVHDAVADVNDDGVRLESGAILKGYDYLVLATGSHHAIRVQARTAAEAKQEYEAGHQALKASKHCLIVGGGPVAVELAGELIHYHPELQITMATSGPSLLDKVPFEWMHAKVAEKLRGLSDKINIKTDTRVDYEGAVWKDRAFTVLDSPTTVAGADNVDLIINGAMLKVDTGFVSIGNKDSMGCLKVNAEHQLEGAPTTTFAVGDVASWDNKLAYLGGLQAEAVAKNIKAMLKGKSPKAKASNKLAAMLVPMGPTAGIGATPMPWPLRKLDNKMVKTIKGGDLFTAMFRKNVIPKKVTRKDRELQAQAIEALKAMAGDQADSLRIINRV